MAETRIVRHPAARRQIREEAAYGLLNFGYAVETATKADAVVRGGHRSFQPGGPVGGTLRRSYHTAAYLDGQRIAGGADENGQPIPDYVPDKGIVVYVGSNSGYGGWVEGGTDRMPARATLVPAAMATRDQAPRLIAAGGRRRRTR
jgi:hypothetical protein